MTVENEKVPLQPNSATGAQKSTPEVPPDNELFAVQVQEQLSEYDIFAGTEDFYKSLTDSTKSKPTTKQTQTPTPPPTPKPAATASIPIPSISSSYKRFSNTQKILALSIVGIATILFYALLKSPSEPTTGFTPTADTQTTSPKPPLTTPRALHQPPEVTQVSPETAYQQIEITQPTPRELIPISLKIAQNFYLKGNYTKAYASYNNLSKNLPASTEGQSLRDFFKLKMGLCAKKINNLEKANQIMRDISDSRCPTVRMLANYHLCQLEMQKEQYLNAFTRSCKTLSLIDAINLDKNLALLLKRDCYFQASKALTKKALALCDADKNLPKDLWANPDKQTEPFQNLNETQLRYLLNAGSEQLHKASLGPQIQNLENAHWSVICNGASIDELMTRFAANANLDIHWDPHSHSIGISKRPVTVYLPTAQAGQIVTIAAGCAGLLASIDGDGVVNIYNPASYSSSSEHSSLLTSQALAMWQKFLLMAYDDKRLPNAHFAKALLQAVNDRPAEAIAEYKLVANQFSNTSLAPVALFNSSKLKSTLLDFDGARQDLIQIVELYPDTEITEKAYLALADTTAKNNLKAEAARIYRKVFHFTLSAQSQTEAAYGAGKCFYEANEYKSAAKWMNQYINLSKNSESRVSYSAYLLLGKSHLGLEQFQQACNAFHYALQGQLTNEEYAETVLAMVEGYMKQENFIQALTELNNADSWRFAEGQSVDLLLLNSKTLRAMGLADKAITILNNRADYITNTQLKAKIAMELAHCYIAKEDTQQARKKLIETLITAEPGPLTHEVTLMLAEVYLKLKEEPHTIYLCSNLLDSDVPTNIKQKALHLLSTAYDRQKNYDKATLTLLGKWK